MRDSTWIIKLDHQITCITAHTLAQIYGQWTFTDQNDDHKNLNNFYKILHIKPASALGILAYVTNKITSPYTSTTPQYIVQDHNALLSQNISPFASAQLNGISKWPMDGIAHNGRLYRSLVTKYVCTEGWHRGLVAE